MELVSKHIRVTSEQDTRLKTISAMTGESVNHLIRVAIDQIDDQRIQSVLHDYQQSHEDTLKRVATDKYLAYEINRVGHNVNQVAKYVNTRKVDDQLLIKAINTLVDQMQKLRGVVDEYRQGN